MLSTLAQTPAAHSLARRVEAGGVLSVRGVSEPAQAAVLGVLRRLFPRRTVLAVTGGVKAQERLETDLQTWLAAVPPSGNDAERPLFYPPWDILPHEDKLPHADVFSERLETLVALRQAADDGGPGPVIVAAVAACLQRTFSPAALARRLRRLRRGDALDPLDLIEWLEDQAYQPEAQVTAKGELALRGGIVDVFPLNSPWPVRLEFFGNELESLRWFDPGTQVTREAIETVTLGPAGELGLLKHHLGLAGGATPVAPAPGTAAGELGTLFDHLPADALVVWCAPDVLATEAAAYEAQVPAGDPFFVAWADVLAALRNRGLTVVALHDLPPAAPAGEFCEAGSEREPAVEAGSEPIPFELPSLEAFRPVTERAPDPQIAERQRREFFAQIHRWLRQGEAVHVVCGNTGEQRRFAEVWAEMGCDRPAASKLPAAAQASGAAAAAPLRLSVQLGSLQRGFLCPEARLVVVTDAEIFGRHKVTRPRRLRSPHATAVRSVLDINFTDLEPGDYVVHLQHGIGRYLGLERLPDRPRLGATGGADEADSAPGEECLVIEYAPREEGQASPRLYVPISESHLVSKYVGAGKTRPALNVLGGTRWTKTKAEAAAAVRDLAADLLSIQAARASLPGFALPADTLWQREFESAFPYQETPDQWRAIEETKRDQEAPRPMDRLICGDVGFGKTEVALRAAFKAIMAGKQVAVLVPTTVLAQQHFNTFRERLADYPARVEVLSRFRSRGQQQQVIADLARGAVDLVIGTHRLLQPDVTFKDLGLVVIDEEQRFGVAHKERFKQLRKLVDVLTLSATPIPRTLYLALTGARDMSTIETPPQDRLPVETIIAPYDEHTIRDAIQRELLRGGQVFFLHNRVFDIESVALKLRSLVPQARIAVGHGQMHADALEEVMTRFVNGEVDVLLSTTIVESGIDIPNANTIIIDRADRFGLSELYQLRGRVGRYKHQAYAYLLIPRHAGLLADARKRITAIKLFSSPGSGFQIAMRDLEIRGAGNLLGAAQSGHITAVGFDLYCQLLKQSIAALKGEPAPRRVEVAVRLDFLDLSAVGDEPSPPPAPLAGGRRRSAGRAGTDIAVPREVATYETDRRRRPVVDEPVNDTWDGPRAAAGLPVTYVPEARDRIELHRKLAQVTDRPGLEALRAELRDRFGRLPPATERLLLLAELKLAAAARGVTAIETRGDRLMLTRGNDYIQAGGRFPRLTKRDPTARLAEIRRLLSLV